jgi:glycosyltransferase involved in cell wall biosynthesis
LTALHVALVGPNFPPQVGGVELVLDHLAQGLAALGCQVEVLVQRRHDDVEVDSVQTLETGVIVRWFASRTHSHRFPVAPSLADHLLRTSRRFDVIHGHSFHAAPGPLAAMLTQRPFVFSPYYHGEGHTPAARALHRMYGPVARRCFSRASVVVCNSHFEEGLVRADYQLGPEKVRVVYPGIDIEEIRAAAPYRLDVPVILMAGRIERYKQIDLAIRAMAVMGVPARLVVLGHGPDEASLRSLAAELGAEDRVVFLGRVSHADVRRWQKTAAVVLTLSRHEAFGLVLLEGIAAGAGAVASDILAHREVAALSSAVTEFVDVDATPAEVASKVTQQLGRRGQPVAKARFPTWTGLAEGCLEIYEEARAVGAHRGAAA